MALCPACGSSRIRNDYKPAPLALRIFFVRAFLCDHCNYQFKVIFDYGGVPARPQQGSATTDRCLQSAPGAVAWI